MFAADISEPWEIPAAKRPHIIVCSGVLTVQVLESKAKALAGARRLYQNLQPGGTLMVAGLAALWLTETDFADTGFHIIKRSQPDAKRPNKMFFVLQKGSAEKLLEQAWDRCERTGVLELRNAGYLAALPSLLPPVSVEELPKVKRIMVGGSNILCDQLAELIEKLQPKFVDINFREKSARGAYQAPSI